MHVRQSVNRCAGSDSEGSIGEPQEGRGRSSDLVGTSGGGIGRARGNRFEASSSSTARLMDRKRLESKFEALF